MNGHILTLSACLAITGTIGCYAGAPELTAQVAPRSLAGTARDGELRVDADGGFVFDEQARLAFDYFQTADRELAPAEHAAWVRAELARSLPAEAAEDAFAAWEAYLAFRGEAAATLAAPTSDLAETERRLLAAVDAELGDYPIAADERAQISRGFALQRISALPEAAREQALAELAAHEPEAGDATAFLDARREIAAARLAGADDLEGLRREKFGADAAARLAALDSQRAEWTRRVAAHRAEREALRSSLVGARLDAAIAALESRDFTPAELRRVHALDRLATQ